ncbi:MAG: efflux RND transporter periplasmic adaptor subunit [Candidatus Marinimicrobia bacterium CG08_land_8_20_14_0_20_45_22]|nr:MAG: efflux RND transporter periplasmic adaptor subunit [Candidatus Marinimicrobia bacterium CG08_land_8_20_14_0_20_45_22]
MKKKILIGIGIVLVALLGWRLVNLFSGANKQKLVRMARLPVAVEVDSVRFAPIVEVRELTGTVFPDYQYVVSPKVAGRLIEIRKRIGDKVKAGEIIARIDNAEYQQGVLEAEANLRIAESSLSESRSNFNLAKQEKDRVESLQIKGIASSSELDAAVSNYSAQKSRFDLARAQVEQRQAALKSAKIRLSYTTLIASQPGLIGERYIDEGALLSANSAVVSVVGIDRVIVRTTVIERDYGKINSGQSAKVSVDAFPNKAFWGKVTRIAPMLQEASRVAQMEVEVANQTHELKPGMFARVEVITAEKANTQVVPSKALVTSNGGVGIFVVPESTTVARYYSVTTGIVTSEYTEIVAPILTGRVITLGQHLLEDGSLVILPQMKPIEISAPDSLQIGEKSK